MKFTATIEENPKNLEELYLPIPEKILRNLGWKENDNMVITKLDNGQFQISKQNNPKTIKISEENEYSLINEWKEEDFETIRIYFKNNEFHFECYPLNTFIHTSSKNIKIAENQAWDQYQKMSTCNHIEFERISKFGHGTCVQCGLFKSYVMEDIHHCYDCDVQGSPFLLRLNNKRYCLEHFIKKVTQLKSEGFITDENNTRYPDAKEMYYEAINLIDKYEISITSNLIKRSTLNDTQIFSFLEEHFAHLDNYIKNYVLFVVKSMDSKITFSELSKIQIQINTVPELYKNFIENYIFHKVHENQSFCVENYFDCNLVNKIKEIIISIKN